MYKTLTSNQNSSNNAPMTSDLQPNMEYQNIKRNNQSMELMRREDLRQKEAEMGNETDNDNDNDQILSLNNSYATGFDNSAISDTQNLPATPRTSRSPPIETYKSPSKDRENFYERLKGLITNPKIEVRLLGLAKRIANEPNFRSDGEQVHLGKQIFGMLNLYDLLECSIAPNKKPNYIENLGLFVKFLTRAKVPLTYVSNRYIKQMILLEAEKGQNQSDSEAEVDQSLDLKPDASMLDSSSARPEKSFLETFLPKVNWLSKVPNPPPGDDDYD